MSFFYVELRLASPTGAEKFFAVFLWGYLRVFFEHLDKVALGAEAEVIGYFEAGIIGEFKEVFRRLDTLLQNILRYGHADLAVEKLGEIRRAEPAFLRDIIECDFGVQVVIYVVKALDYGL